MNDDEECSSLYTRLNVTDRKRREQLIKKASNSKLKEQDKAVFNQLKECHSRQSPRKSPVKGGSPKAPPRAPSPRKASSRAPSPPKGKASARAPSPKKDIFTPEENNQQFLMTTKIKEIQGMVSDEYKKAKVNRVEHKYVEKDRNQCKFLIGKLKTKQDLENEVIVSYPISVRLDSYRSNDEIAVDDGPYVIHKFCFLQSELLEIVNTSKQKNVDAQFTKEMVQDIKQNFENIGINSESVDIEMSQDFQDVLIEHGTPLLSGVDSKTISKSTIFNFVLNYMIKYMDQTDQNSDPATFYSRIVGFGKKLASGALYSMKWVMNHPILSMICFLMVKLTKVVFCLWTSNVKEEMIKALVDAAFEFLGNSPLVLLFKSVVTLFGKCTASLLSGNPIWAVFECLTGSLTLMFQNSGGVVSWIAETASRGVVWMFESILGNYSSVGSFIMTGTELIKDPYSVISSIFEGETQGMLDRKAMLGQLTYNFAGDMNYVMMSIILEFMPYKILETLIGTLIDSLVLVDATGITAVLKGLKELHNSMMGIVNSFVTSMSGVKTRLSCLDLLIYIRKYTSYGNVIYMFIVEIKDICLDLMPCLFSTIWVNLQKLFGMNVVVTEEGGPCCMKDMVNGMKQAFDQVQLPTVKQAIDNIASYIPGGSYITSFSNYIMGTDGRLIYVGKGRGRGSSRKRDGRIVTSRRRRKDGKSIVVLERRSKRKDGTFFIKNNHKSKKNKISLKK